MASGQSPGVARESIRRRVATRRAARSRFRTGGATRWVGDSWAISSGLRHWGATSTAGHPTQAPGLAERSIPAKQIPRLRRERAPPGGRWSDSRGGIWISEMLPLPAVGIRLFSTLDGASGTVPIPTTSCLWQWRPSAVSPGSDSERVPGRPSGQPETARSAGFVWRWPNGPPTRRPADARTRVSGGEPCPAARLGGRNRRTCRSGLLTSDGPAAKAVAAKRLAESLRVGERRAHPTWPCRRCSSTR